MLTGFLSTFAVVTLRIPADPGGSILRTGRDGFATYNEQGRPAPS